MNIRPNKLLSQNYLQDKNIARKIVGSITSKSIDKIYEIGPGHGILTEFLKERFGEKLFLIEIDKSSVDFLKRQFSELKERILYEDFLKFEWVIRKNEKVVLIGNFPYHITSPIFFRVLEYREVVTEVVAMIQKEVAERLVNLPGTKKYGLLSVLLQTFYHIDYLFTVGEQVFYPRPKVKSAVIRMIRNERDQLPCPVELYISLVKKAFNQRRKTLRNALKTILPESMMSMEILNRRAEQLSPTDFISLCHEMRKAER